MTFRTIHKQVKEDLAKTKTDIEKTVKDLADDRNVITIKGSEVSTLKEQVKCVFRHLCLSVCGFANVESCVCVFVVGWCVRVCDTHTRLHIRKSFCNLPFCTIHALANIGLSLSLTPSLSLSFSLALALSLALSL